MFTSDDHMLRFAVYKPRGLDLTNFIKTTTPDSCNRERKNSFVFLNGASLPQSGLDLAVEDLGGRLGPSNFDGRQRFIKSTIIMMYSTY